MRTMMSQLKLTVNQQRRALPPAGRDVGFSGFHPRSELRLPNGRVLLGTTSAREVDRLWGRPMELTTRRKAWRDVEELMSRINRKLRGWSNDFRIGTVSQAYRNINSHTRYRVRQWLCAKFKEQGQGKKRFSHQVPAPAGWDCTSFQRFPEEPKHLQNKDLRVHYFAKKSLSWYAPNIRP